MGEVRSEYKLKNSPEDSISSLEFAPNSCNILLASSWDSYIRTYEVDGNVLRKKVSHSGFPVLDFTISPDHHVYSGGLDGTLMSYHMERDSMSEVGEHEEAIRCVNYSTLKQLVVSGSWDSYIKLWDSRTMQCIGKHSQLDRVYSMDVKDEVVVVGTSARKVMFWDLRNMDEPVQQRDSLLKYQTRCLRLFPNKQGYVLGSIEGRVAVEYFDLNVEVQKKKYAFKCHRMKEQGIEQIYPVNAISFHEEHSTFATGGSDGVVSVWDGFNKKRLCQFHRYPTGISTLCFSGNGARLAIGCSFLHELIEAPKPTPEDQIFVRLVTDQETKPK